MLQYLIWPIKNIGMSDTAIYHLSWFWWTADQHQGHKYTIWRGIKFCQCSTVHIFIYITELLPELLWYSKDRNATSIRITLLQLLIFSPEQFPLELKFFMSYLHFKDTQFFFLHSFCWNHSAISEFYTWNTPSRPHIPVRRNNAHLRVNS